MDRTGYYDTEATPQRGGAERAAGATDAVLSLVPARGVAVDVAGGTGSVSSLLAARGLDVLVLDRSTGMLGLAAQRLPGRVLAADAVRLPLADASIDLVTMVWLLHLPPIDAADAAVTEAARVLRPGGHLGTTVDNESAHGVATPTHCGDTFEHLSALTGRLGLVASGTTTFTGTTGWDAAAPHARATFRLTAYRCARTGSD